MSIKQDFDFFKNNDLLYLDSGATTQKPGCFLDTLKAAYINNSNISRSSYKLAAANSDKVEETRKTVAKFLNCKSENIAFTSSATSAINMVCSSLDLKKDEKILLSYAEHHSNILPFLNKYPKQILFCKLTKNGLVDVHDYENLLKNNKVKFVSITGFSNVIGISQPVEKLVKLAHNYKVEILIDATQMVVQEKVDVKKLNADYLVFSAHKIYGPNGVGILYFKKEFKNNYNLGGGTVFGIKNFKPEYVNPPYVYEAGTLPIPEIIAFNSSMLYFMKNKKDNSKLISYLEKELKKLNAKIVGKPQIGIISFYFENISSLDISYMLSNENVCVRSGTHCASLINEFYKIPATLRVSLGIYNDKKDVELFIEKLKKVLTKLK